MSVGRPIGDKGWGRLGSLAVDSGSILAVSYTCPCFPVLSLYLSPILCVSCSIFSFTFSSCLSVPLSLPPQMPFHILLFTQL